MIISHNLIILFVIELMYSPRKGRKFEQIKTFKKKKSKLKNTNPYIKINKINLLFYFVSHFYLFLMEVFMIASMIINVRDSFLMEVMNIHLIKNINN